MQITVRLFAGLREVAGTDRLVEDFDGGSVTIEELRARLQEAHPKLQPYLPGVAIAVNEEYILEPGTELADGDTVALVPPIAGGANETPLHLVTAARLEPMALRDAVMTRASGACVLFEGVVRDHHEGRAVERVEYEAYEEMAVRQLESVAVEVMEAFRDREVYAIGIHHRVGPLDVGETSLLVAVSAAHRHDAFEAGERAVDRVKETVPVWKKEWGPDGAHWQEGIRPRPAAR
ncbi:MAG: molybdenum cofactor biosynthesis protein MoaE [Dehalococcoidia bacterium]